MLREGDSVDESTKEIMRKLTKEINRTKRDRCGNRVSNVWTLLGLADGTGFGDSFAVFMSDPEKETKYLGMSAEVLSKNWRQNMNCFTPILVMLRKRSNFGKYIRKRK